jgi:hypothetical protein
MALRARVRRLRDRWDHRLGSGKMLVRKVAQPWSRMMARRL